MFTRFFTLRAQSPVPRRSSRSGFALLITVVLMAFLVLILVTLSALTRVEVRIAANSGLNGAARQNALMALNIALGELQKAAGPDQRTTAAAALGEDATGVAAENVADNGLVAPVNGTRHWTGVWGNKDAPESLFTQAPAPVLLTWLVSGNTANFTASTNGRITSPESGATHAFAPDSLVLEDGGAPLSATTTATTPLRIAGQPAALLIGPASTGAEPASYVAAPLRDIDATNVPGLVDPATVGRYAWWVGDEGVKARFNLSDPYQANSAPAPADTENNRLSRYRVLATQRNGIELMTAFGGSHYPLTSEDPDSPAMLRVAHTLGLAQLPVAAPGVAPDALKRHVHDITTNSLGVLSNSLFGGLRRDLSFHLDSRSGDTFLDGRNILPDGPDPVQSYSGSRYEARPSLFSETTAHGGLGLSSLNLSPRLGPKWDQLKSFYQTAYDMPVTLHPRPAVDIDQHPVVVQAAISPVVLETRTLFALRSGPEIDTSIIVILGNPYSRPMTAPAGLNVRLALHPVGHSATAHRKPEFGLACYYYADASVNHSEAVSLFTRTRSPSSFSYYPILKYEPSPAGGEPVDADSDHPGLLDRVLFQIPPNVLNLAPGEAKAYQFNPGATLPSEVVDGVPFTVVPLREMTASYNLTWFSRSCDPRYQADSAAFPENIFTGGDIPEGARFQVGIVSSVDNTVSHILTSPGKPRSVLQTLGPLRLFESVGGSLSQAFGIGEDGETFFAASRTPVAGVRTVRYFGRLHSTGYFGESILSTHAEGNMIGAHQLAEHYTSTNQRRHQIRALYSRYYYDSDPSSGANFLINGLDDATATQSAWGEGYAGNPLRVSPRGRLAVNDVPAASSDDDVPILSLAQLQHADLTADDEALGTSMQPGNPFANSRYNRFVPRSAVRTDPMDNYRSRLYSNSSDNSSGALGDSPWWYSGYVPDLPKAVQIRRYDISHLLNTALWDGFFFSTVIPAPGGDPTPAPAPANRRLVYAGDPPTLGQLRGSDSSSAIPAPSDLAPGENGRVPAAHLLINGAFNVNSTSKNAWLAFLSGQRGLAVGNAPATETHTPFARSIRQPGLSQAQLSANDATVRAAADTHYGFRSLTDTQLDALATQIVAQVKARGPFLSLAQFVNRHLTAAAAPGDAIADTSLSGALQRAIDLTDINAPLNKNSSLPRADASQNRHTEYPDNAFMPEGDTSGLSTYMASPGWLSQADLLQAIAPALASRSDTFVIRAYGEALDPVNSTSAAPVVLARAWCEAVVQRLPDYVDASERPTLPPSLANAENRTFGRRFHIVSFRWLSADDI